MNPWQICQGLCQGNPWQNDIGTTYNYSCQGLCQGNPWQNDIGTTYNYRGVCPWQKDTTPGKWPLSPFSLSPSHYYYYHENQLKKIWPIPLLPLLLRYQPLLLSSNNPTTATSLPALPWPPFLPIDENKTIFFIHSARAFRWSNSFHERSNFSVDPFSSSAAVRSFPVTIHRFPSSYFMLHSFLWLFPSFLFIFVVRISWEEPPCRSSDGRH